jgi:hypothetical protein
MLSWFRKKVQPPCECHDFEHYRKRTFWHYQITNQRLLGATLSWGGSAVPHEETDFTCDWCGRAFTRRGYVAGNSWHRKYPPDVDGWPTVNGERMELET